MDMGSECALGLRLQDGRQEVNSEGFECTVGFASYLCLRRAIRGLQLGKEILAAREL